ncbi:hypothetical protein ACJO15_23430 [Vibrio parahaemolyticus]|uniref:hypothetical protein n=2 Tax=Vibrio parahaemolyticus TaxID=670 RepID=UPI0003FCB2B8|nr:hypothetical protein [Vibrio parahaemolyticus]MBE4083407.1 hypothetical protein [Vibrio parahaemolyticus]MBE4471981.1 hypothetical protein [Vibrio parahaemolyticus]MEA5296399.1 hypothetical protein [Vibrio parahaemolyticus]HCH6179986.1 hypothetical protein [Vibrio parahaemolyticus]HCH6572408.1 hypothetical protein [Vibrio parahaemolyticus]
MEHNFERLKEHILLLSNSSEFHHAKNEWLLVGVEIQEDFDSCPCGQPIKELCYIENQLNGNKTHVGNVCVNRFIGIDTGNLFAGLKRIAKDVNANANEDLIIHAYKLGYIYENEYRFLMQTKRKRSLSEKQVAWKQKINRRILHQTVVRKNT